MGYEDALIGFARTMRELQANVEKRMREQQKGEAFKPERKEDRDNG